MAKKKRLHGEGSIFQRSNGTWRAQLTVDGQRLSFGARTQCECREWLKQTSLHFDHELKYSRIEMTLEDYLRDWLDSSKASLRKTTWTHYNQVTTHYVLPNIGQLKLVNLRHSHIQKLYNYLQKQKVGAYTIRKIHTVLHSALAQSVKIGLLRENPASNVILPRIPSKEMQVLNEDQATQLLIAAKSTSFEALLHLALTTGMRQMELLGLNWDDIDWEKNTIRVERQLERPDSATIQFTPPKTKFGRRTISLGTNTMAILKVHRIGQQSIKVTAGDQWIENGLIFTNRFGGPIHPRNLLRDFKRLLKEANLPQIRFHDLRHTCASLLLNLGIPVIEVSRRLGHSRASITLDIYGHLIPGMRSETAQLIDDLVSPIELHQIAPEESPKQEVSTSKPPYMAN